MTTKLMRELEVRALSLEKRVKRFAEWDESKHPRDPGGEGGGQFVPSISSGGRRQRTTPLPTKFPVTVYREIRVDRVEDIITRSAGKFWTQEVGFADSYNDEFLTSDRSRGMKVLLIAKVGRNQIDWPSTKKARSNKDYGREQEITLKRGTKVDVEIELPTGKRINKKMII